MTELMKPEELKRDFLSKPFEPEVKEKIDALSQEEKLMDGIGLWISYFRANPHRFVSEYLQLKPFSWFQKVLLFMMFKNNYFMWWASRGLGKTHLTALYCVVRCILYPGTKICIASGIKAQALQVISEKVADFRINCPNIALEIDDFRPNMQDAFVGFANGSWIKVVAANDNARSARANVIVVDEFRMVNEDIIKTVLRKFLTASRRPGFVDKVLPDGSSPYATYEEANTEIYLSSAWYKSHWSWEKFLAFTDAMLKGRPYFTCGLPYQLGIKERIIMRDVVVNEMKEADFNEQLFKMEMETIPFGESEKAYFKFDDLSKARQSSIPNIPLNSEQYVTLRDKKYRPDFNKKKRGKEIRVLSMDVALMSSTSRRTNDATVFTMISGVPNGGEYNKTVDYIETSEGMLTQTQALTAKRLFYDLDCDVFVVDAAGVGQSIFDACVEKTFDYERNVEYPAWAPMTDDEEIRNRCKDPDAVEVMFPIKVTGAYATQMNHDMALYTRSQFIGNKIKLLLTESEASEHLMTMPEYRKLGQDEQTRVRTPYIQTTLLITEMINLEVEIKSGLVKLTEPSARARKDRYSSLAYGLYFMKQKEQELKIVYDGRDDLEILMSYISF